ncbi:WD40-repeat-containing domain protein [Mycena olivaceomarginata]|nr:WD40-repeat-containing domain protein [Mycena olivaceomarginata]
MSVLEKHTQVVASVALSPDGKRIVSGSYDETVRVWDSESGEVIAGPFNGHTDSVTSVAFSPDGKRIVSGSEDKTVRVWDSESGEVVAGPFNGHTDWLTSVALSPDGKRIVSGSRNKTVRMWDLESGEVVAGPFNGHTNSVRSVAFSPDGRRIVSGSHDKTVRMWDSESGEVVAGPFNGHTDHVASVAFSPDGKQIVSAARFDHLARDGWYWKTYDHENTDHLTYVEDSPRIARSIISTAEEFNAHWLLPWAYYCVTTYPSEKLLPFMEGKTAPYAPKALAVHAHLVRGIIAIEGSFLTNDAKATPCDACFRGKQVAAVIPKLREGSKSKEALELVFVDTQFREIHHGPRRTLLYPTMSEIRRKLVIVDDALTLIQTCLLIVFSKGTFLEVYVPTVFENYVADVEVDNKHVELALWDTALPGA